MRRCLRVCWAGLLASCLAGVCGVGVASAAATPGEFGGEGTGAGQFIQPRGVAVDAESGDVYVADRNNSRVDVFSDSGAFVLAWGWGVADGSTLAFQHCEATCFAGIAGAGAGQLSEPGGVAVNNDLFSASHGDVYVEDLANHRVEKFSATGEFLLMFGGEVNATTHGDVCIAGEVCQAGKVGPGAGEFGPLAKNAVAVDPAGNVYVGDSERVQKFSEDGVLETQIPLTGAAQILGLAADSAEDIYVLDEGAPGVHKYEGAGTELGEPRDPSAQRFNSTIALGPASELFLVEPEHRVAEFEPSGTQVLSVDESGAERLGPPQGLAFESGGLLALYPAKVLFVGLPPKGPVVVSEGSSEVLPVSVLLGGVMNAEGHETEYHFEYGETVGYGLSTPVEVLAAGFEDTAVSADVTGLRPNRTYHFRLVAVNHCVAGEPARECVTDGPDQTVVTLPPVGIDSESVSLVGATSASLAAELNPHGFATSYRFEYGKSVVYEASVPAGEASAGAGSSDTTVGVVLEGLQPEVTYHFRMVAHSVLGESVGDDETFRTLAGSGSALIDGRSWELVSPPDKLGVALESLSGEGAAIQAAQDGGAFAYVAKGPVDSDPAGNRSVAESQLLATRDIGGGWSTQNISVKHEAPAGLRTGYLSEYKVFSPDLSAALVEPEGSTPLVEPVDGRAQERTPYIRETDGVFVPIVNPGNVAEGMKFGPVEERGGMNVGSGVEFVAGSSSLGDVVVSAPQSLVAGFATGGLEALYEWRGGVLVPVSVLPSGASAATEGGAKLGNADLLVRNAVSEDGSRVFFESAASHHLFVRDVVGGVSVRLDVPATGVVGGSGVALFEGASVDGSRAFFEDEARLVTGSSAESGEPDLYVCEVGAVGVGEVDCSRHLRDLSVGAQAGEAADVLGAMVGSSESGGVVYFVANGVLGNGGVPVAGAVHGDCVRGGVEALPPAGNVCNLYGVDVATGLVRLVAVLSNDDFPDWQAGEFHSNLGTVTSRVSPDGGFVAFMSQRSLTGFNNRDVVSGVPDEEVFEYDAATGRVVCVSCDASGARPRGVLDPGPADPTLLVDRSDVWGEQWLSGLVPGWTRANDLYALYQSRYLSNEGRLFFDSTDGLVPGDVNGQWDVYEFEPENVGGCSSGLSSSDAVFVGEVAGSSVDGCVGLISSGSSASESTFLDASGMGPGGSEGEDVFFLTAARLSAADVDEAYDVYDAHVCSGVSPCLSVSAGGGEACSSAVSCRAGVGVPSPGGVFAAPASSLIPGSGNLAPVRAVKVVESVAQVRAQDLFRALKACRVKHNKHKRVVCEASARRRFGPPGKRKKKAGKAKKAGRANGLERVVGGGGR